MSPTITAAPGAGTSQESPASRGRQVFVGAVVLVLVVAGAAIWLLRSGSDQVPFTDARSSGTLTLCGTDGKPVTSGSTDHQPFVARAVGATAVTNQPAGSRATLYAFQPREGAESEEWSGQLLTAASTYTNPKHPMAQATSADIALGDFLVAFPPRWDGLIQLRLYRTSGGAGIAATYDTADIKIDGSTWKVVGTPGPSPCSDGDATSDETKPHTTP